jgi:hypothetical protein
LRDQQHNAGGRYQVRDRDRDLEQKGKQTAAPEGLAQHHGEGNRQYAGQHSTHQRNVKSQP